MIKLPKSRKGGMVFFDATELEYLQACHNYLNDGRFDNPGEDSAKQNMLIATLKLGYIVHKVKKLFDID